MEPVGSINVRELLRDLEDGARTSEGIVRDCLERAVAREDELKAWAFLAGNEAIEEAKLRDRQRQHGLLYGIPIAVKDLSDTANMPTGYGSPAFEKHRPGLDSACVTLVKAAGAVILGKTATVEFGATHPTKTRNPRNIQHTPGGSSSGSAAVVADGQVPLATGTQIGGSIIRPAAFCGVVGLKPTTGSIPTAGTKSFSWSLDSIGGFGNSVSDVALFFDALTGACHSETLPDKTSAPRVGIFFGPFVSLATPEALEIVERVSILCENEGASIKDVMCPIGFESSLDWQKTISSYELSRSLRPEFEAKGFELGGELVAEIESGQQVSTESYLKAKTDSAGLALRIQDMFREFDILLTLSAVGEAPVGLSSTGDATFNKSWSLLGLPCLSIPVSVGPQGLPLCVQVIGQRFRDRELLEAGNWLEKIIKKNQECLS